MKAVSLFSGIGGMDLGAERAGIDVMLQVEIDDYCRRVLQRHWPDVRRIADVRDVTAEDCRGTDLIFGGFPCQPVSVAGKRRGTSDERWLWPEFARLIREVRPRYAVMENVPGLLTAGMGIVLGDLAEMGFDAEWGMLSACALGAPHTRERVFILANANSVRWRCGRDRRADAGGLHYWQAAQGKSRWKDVECWLRETLQDGDWQTTSTGVLGMDDGISARLDRLKSAGNAVVPQAAEYVFRRLMEADRRRAA